ncbi:MAG: MFS transporter [Actinomycetes bacterium]
MFTSLKFFNYRLVFTYSSLTSMAGWANQVTMDWLVLHLTGSAAALGGMLVFQLAPYIFISVIGGSIADRYNKRNFLMLLAAFDSVFSFGLYILYHRGLLTYSFLCFTALALASINAAEGPVRTAISLEVVKKENHANAMSLNSVTFNIGRLAGTFMAGLLITRFDNGAPWFVIGVIYLGLFITLPFLRIHEIETEDFGASQPGRITDAVSFLRTNLSLVLSMVITAVFVGLGMQFGLTSSLMVKKVFHQNATYLGYIGASISIGCIIGAVVAARWSVPGHIPKLSTMLKSAIATAIFWMISALMPTFWGYAFFAGIASIFQLTYMVTSNSLVTANSPEHFRGRIYGIYLFIFYIGAACGGPILGQFAQTFGIRIALFTGGAITLAICVIIFFRTRAWPRLIAE